MEEIKRYSTPLYAYQQLLSNFVSFVNEKGEYTTIFTKGSESAEKIYIEMIIYQKHIINFMFRNFLNKEFLNENSISITSLNEKFNVLSDIYRIQNSLLKDDFHEWKSITFTECSRTVPTDVPDSPNCGPENDNSKLRNTALANIKLIQEKLKELGVTGAKSGFSRRSRKTSKRRSRK